MFINIYELYKYVTRTPEPSGYRQMWATSFGEQSEDVCCLRAPTPNTVLPLRIQSLLPGKVFYIRTKLCLEGQYDDAIHKMIS